MNLNGYLFIVFRRTLFIGEICFCSYVLQRTTVNVSSAGRAKLIPTPCGLFLLFLQCFPFIYCDKLFIVTVFGDHKRSKSHASYLPMLGLSKVLSQSWGFIIKLKKILKSPGSQGRSPTLLLPSVSAS